MALIEHLDPDRRMGADQGAPGSRCRSPGPISGSRGRSTAVPICRWRWGRSHPPASPRPGSRSPRPHHHRRHPADEVGSRVGQSPPGPVGARTALPAPRRGGARRGRGRSPARCAVRRPRPSSVCLQHLCLDGEDRLLYREQTAGGRRSRSGERCSPGRPAPPREQRSASTTQRSSSLSRICC